MNKKKKKATQTTLRSSGLSDPILLHKVNIAAYRAHLHSLNINHIGTTLGQSRELKDNINMSLSIIYSFKTTLFRIKL